MCVRWWLCFRFFRFARAVYSFINPYLSVYLGVILVKELRKFTLEHFKENDGKNGKPAYIAYKGKVYDVSDNYLWGDGGHFGVHQAGLNVTDGMSDAPHGEDKLEAITLIGELVK